MGLNRFQTGAFTHACLDGLVIGVGIAFFKTFQTELWKKVLNFKGYFVAFGSICLTGAMFLSDTPFTWAHSALTYPLIAFGFGGWVMIPGVSFLARISYAIYLVQKLVFHGMSQFLETRGVTPYSYLGMGVTLLACIGAASIRHFLIERPFLMLRDFLLARQVKPIKPAIP